MTLRDKFLNAVKKLDNSYVPMEFNLCPSLKEELKKRTGFDSVAECFNFPFRDVKALETTDRSIYNKYFDSLENMYIGEWGVGHKRGYVAHFTKMEHPMKNFQTIEEFSQYPYPDPETEMNWDKVISDTKSIIERGLSPIAQMQITIFEMAWYLRGMDNFMIDMVINQELAEYHLDRITSIRCEMAKRYAAAGVDLIFLGDDVSTQLDMMMNPDMWRKTLKPRLAAVIKAAKDVNPDIIVIYHGDGNLQKIIPDLIEIGVQILNPIQPECMDPILIHEKYGDKLSFWGTIGTQTTIPFGTPQDVREACLKMIKTVGKDGGLILAPTHKLEPEVPWENIQAFVDTINEYNNK